MIVVFAARIEGRVAFGALKVTLQILLDRQFGATSTTENRFFDPFTLRPGLGWVIGQRRMAVFAGVIQAAAAHLDGDDVGGSVVVTASRLEIKIGAVNYVSRNSSQGLQYTPPECARCLEPYRVQPDGFLQSSAV